MSLKKFIPCIAVAFLVACGDDDSSFAPRDDESSSSIEEESSSSVEDKSSSSSVKDVILSGDSHEGSSPSSSSSVKSSSSAKSSSSKEIATNSSSSRNDEGDKSSSSAKSSSSVASSSSEYVPFDHSKTLAGAYKVGENAYKQFTDTRNRRSYYYITIYSEYKGRSVTVMAENLNIGKMVLGTEDQKDDKEIERYCYNNDTTKCDEFGGLYQWAEMMQLPSRCNIESCADLIQENHRGICPEGWRLFTWDDYTVVMGFKDDYNDGVKGLRSTYGFNGTNSSGFSLVGAGQRTIDGKFDGIKQMTAWFRPEEYESDAAIRAHHGRLSSSLDSGPDKQYRELKTKGFSVRCVMVEKETAPSSSSEASSSSVESSSSEYVPYDHQNDLFADSLNSGAYKKFTDVRNGRSYYYLTINGEKIGGEKSSVTVMAENLNIGIDVPGTEDQSDDENIERYCYNDDTTNCDKYGGLYQWAEMMQLPSRCNVDACEDLIEENHRGICPEGWHVLTYDEYVIVLTANKEEKNIRAISFGGDNLTGYSLIGAGHNRNHQFADLDNMTFWFYPENGTMSEPSAFSGYQLKSSAGMDFTSSRKSYANSVRCVKD